METNETKIIEVYFTRTTSYYTVLTVDKDFNGSQEELDNILNQMDNDTLPAHDGTEDQIKISNGTEDDFGIYIDEKNYIYRNFGGYRELDKYFC